MLNALVQLGCTFNRRILGTALLAIAANATMAVAATPQVKEGPVNVTIAGYSSGGQVSVFGEGVIDAVRRSYPNSSIIYEPGNPAGGLEYLRTGRRPFALESIVEPRMAYEGRAPFREAYPEGSITGVLNGAPDVFALKVYARKQFLDQHGITSFDDLIKKEIPMRLSVNQPGNLWAREHVRALLSYYGKTMKDIESWGGTLVPQPTGASNDLMRDSRLDVIITGGATPAGAIVELGSVQDIAFIPLSKELAEYVAKELGVKVGVIPGGAYTFQKEDLYVPFTSFIIVAGPAATFDDAYKLTKSMYEQMERYRSLHPALSLASRERLPDVGSLKLHPGAEAFYREVGLIE
ncbi:TAXI family TRAP transporter solute-binding subunit [Ectopseudomonas oleovorans]|uniref:Putative periplasmic binding protein n=1 Tax=Ectopseudomonas oleovorans (strain CECT 5344) TaxID=1182590 RepID=W6RK30_ECTO5|nr:TAXI family TRAP transporter solute-binding subunit [Pseudomonas oleovorans]CDM42164.1 putative periplasmic binding protein [Pseudomonas oleovorans CECT 5344]CDR92787.1 putative periplasmic binding protein [Pseudomonas oleovorans]